MNYRLVLSNLLSTLAPAVLGWYAAHHVWLGAALCCAFAVGSAWLVYRLERTALVSVQKNAVRVTAAVGEQQVTKVLDALEQDASTAVRINRGDTPWLEGYLFALRTVRETLKDVNVFGK